MSNVTVLRTARIEWASVANHDYEKAYGIFDGLLTYKNMRFLAQLALYSDGQSASLAFLTPCCGELLSFRADVLSCDKCSLPYFASDLHAAGVTIEPQPNGVTLESPRARVEEWVDVLGANPLDACLIAHDLMATLRELLQLGLIQPRALPWAFTSPPGHSSHAVTNLWREAKLEARI